MPFLHLHSSPFVTLFIIALFRVKQALKMDQKMLVIFLYNLYIFVSKQKSRDYIEQ